MHQVLATLTQQEVDRIFRHELDKRDMRPLTYIASPYAHSDEKVIAERVRIATDYAAMLMVKGVQCYSPLTMSHHIHLAMKHKFDKTDFDWYSYDLMIMQFVSDMHVLMIDGWEQSKGVQLEIQHAHKNNIHITYIGQDEVDSMYTNVFKNEAEIVHTENDVASSFETLEKYRRKVHSGK